jgi:hypothetical protein
MTTTPRSHEPNPHRTRAPSAAVGDQVLDDLQEDANDDDVIASQIGGTDLAVKSADRTTSTADGRDIGRESGELYGVGIAPTGDVDEDGVRGAQDYDDDGGESWMESLMTSAAEHGTAGESPVDAPDEDEPDEAHDRPPADLGSGGPAGL